MIEFEANLINNEWRMSLRANLKNHCRESINGWKIIPSRMFNIDGALKKVYLPIKTETTIYISSEKLSEVDILSLHQVFSQINTDLKEKWVTDKDYNKPDSRFIHFTHFGIDPNDCSSYHFYEDNKQIMVHFFMKSGGYVLPCRIEEEEIEKVRNIF
jgi:hypothetical protein